MYYVGKGFEWNSLGICLDFTQNSRSIPITENK